MWDVTTAEWNKVQMAAHTVRIEHGALVGYDRAGDVIFAFAPGTWLRVAPVTQAEPAEAG